MKGFHKSRAIAYFISSHGLGHAARAAAVMEALLKRDELVKFIIFSDVARSFFQASIGNSFEWVCIQTDVGLAQKDPLHEDIPLTLERLNLFYPLRKQLIEAVTTMVRFFRCEAVICDISPLGIAVAMEASIACFLIENFTWDWIYKAYQEPGLDSHGRYLGELFKKAHYLIQTEPVCVLKKADITTSCVSRSPRRGTIETRRALDIPEKKSVILLTLGGMNGSINVLNEASSFSDYVFLLPSPRGDLQRRGNIVWIPRSIPFYYPDIVAASDAVIGKLGYSTLAETYNCGVPFGYVTRSTFPESRVLGDFLLEEKRGIPIDAEMFRTGKWLYLVEEVLSVGKREPASQNGSDTAAEFILTELGSRK